MRAIIFAGGVGTRLWPLSRKNSPKQFEKIVGDKSTLQLAVERLYPRFKPQDIYISTGEKYTDMVRIQLPEIPSENVIGEPEMRDVGPAVGFVSSILAKIDPLDPIVILWSDHLVKKQELFRKVIRVGVSLIKENSERIIFIAQKPRFASQNLGWIKYGSLIGKNNTIAYYNFKDFLYRPKKDLAEKFFKSGKHAWNIGYFVTTPKFLLSLYEMFVPEMYKGLQEIQKSYGNSEFNDVLNKIYPTLEKISFDNAILEKMDSSKGIVISEDLEWSDVGAWEALKEALQSTPSQNVISGKVLTTDCKDSLIYNYTNQLVVAIDMEGYLVVNTNDAVLVCKKESVPKIKKLVESLEGTEHKHLT